MSDSQTQTRATTPQTARLLELLEPVLARISALDPASRHDPDAIRELETTLEAEFPWAGDYVQAINDELARGVGEGWLAERGEPQARFGRVSKACPATHDLSIDVVSMVGAAVEHSHPQGEVTVGFPADDEQSCHFEGRPPGWVFLPPGSRHVPTVTGGRMNLVYFLPQGAVEWHFG
ncbi:DUF4863 family protein [Pseudenhygromyxa sp. WMMC2535]|uniref:4-hydroxylaminobenzoate lyase n=1 Tax=Pseudenhygromyxa sp. WMMC2535 TaxID=2712867 RepID=UPI001556A7A6|nr:DUF4863 family protein [Pseudenhygromyxa sp. WMMC2535]NVB41299.1 DUF4863 family protein [Pseudenhygromyxa sp. WMMC2535]